MTIRTNREYQPRIATPTDHLGQKSDREYARRNQIKEEARARQSEGSRIIKTIVRSLKSRRGGVLSRTEIETLEHLFRCDLAATIAGRVTYGPGRQAIARALGISVRSVSRALTRLKDLGLIQPVLFERGGRCPETGKGLVTRWRSGNLGRAIRGLIDAGHEFAKSLLDRARGFAVWASDRVKMIVQRLKKSAGKIMFRKPVIKLGSAFENKAGEARSSGTRCPGILRNSKLEKKRAAQAATTTSASTTPARGCVTSIGNTFSKRDAEDRAAFEVLLAKISREIGTTTDDSRPPAQRFAHP